eukprot:scaffold650231_cov41-Prasinocladus_malaysianus.AAC.1
MALRGLHDDVAHLAGKHQARERLLGVHGWLGHVAQHEGLGVSAQRVLWNATATVKKTESTGTADVCQ